MKIVLINKMTGRYYHAPGHWVRRADNALTFENLSAAEKFTRVNHLNNAHPVERFAPYMMELLRCSSDAFWKSSNRGHATGWADWCSSASQYFLWN
jgi:hypothetical protein